MRRLNSLSRRDFLKIMGGVAATAAVGGCVNGMPWTRDTMSVVERGGQQMLNELEAGSISGFMGWEPFNSQAVYDDLGYILKKSGDIWSEHPCCVLAYSDDWFQDTEDEEAENVLKRMAWAHMKATEWINEAKYEDVEKRERLIEITGDFVGRDDEVVDMSLDNILFVYDYNRDGIERYIEKLNEYELFDQQAWTDRGYEAAGDFASDLLVDKYVDWAVENRDLTAEEVFMETGGEEYEIRIGYLEAAQDHVGYFVARDELELFNKLGLEITFENHYGGGSYLMLDGFHDGDVDVGYLGIAPVTQLMINNDIDVRVFGGVNDEGHGLVVKSDVDSMEGLEGETVASPAYGSVQEFLLYMAAEEAGILVDA
ncbi:substrate-binding domain-containing protein [Methanonatronarchaeum sp. AMET6-2]|uniref:substrate-binding domain-containing protein n=1 Tax=Methanonatronarchaeum sp. AMET6-2 TaxID=2933293 RepID=UPI001226CECC|nr:ABC transporter substrate-binding protein [Methanonatronarchaeum sp. AMET6-2]RZN60300.1 MAG: hypothetical protein EF811_06775 [Methanonatronarchaeia archaeon]UOY10545.1 substrate-binding domain-containing protein [Methanonatronarchaeum sp. AMET6-2]